MNAATSFKSADDLVSERLTGVHTAWKQAAAGRMAPKREDITPSLLRSSLPWIWMIDVVDGGADFRFRFAGDRVIQFMGRRYAGSLLSEHLQDPFFQRMKAILVACTRLKRPLVGGPERSTMKGKEFLEMEVIVLPLSEDGENVSGLFGAMEVRGVGEYAKGR